MKKNNVLRNNRGAALVSIMIAVAFITILATSLLYMSYNNFKMKVVNYESKANFYDTEQNVTKMSTNLRNKVMSTTSPINTLKLTTGVTSNRYDAKKLAELVFPSSSISGNADAAVATAPNGDVFTFATTVDAGNANYLETPISSDVTQITLKGIQVTQKEKNKNNTNKITTDLVMYIQESSTPSDVGGIGDFSIMMDSTVACSATWATKLNLFGNGFFLGVDPDTTSSSKPGRKDNNSQAIYLTGECVYNILGDYTLVYGDIVLKDGAALNLINGSLTVFGNIYLDDKSTITSNGKIYLPDTSILDHSGQPYKIHYSGEAKQHLYPETLEATIERVSATNCNDIVKGLKLDDTDKTNDGLVAQILSAQKNVNNTGSAYHFYEIGETNNQSTTAVTINGVSYKTQYFKTDVVNADLVNSLVFLKEATTIKQSNENSTLISRNKITFSEVHELNLTKMGENAFTYLTLRKKDVDDGKYPGFNYVENVHRIKLKEKQYEVGGFFNANAENTVKQIMGKGVNNAGGDPNFYSSIGYQNWSKE